LSYHVRVAAHCHEPEQEIWLSEHDLAQGWHQMGCKVCDTLAICGQRVPILAWQPHWSDAWCPTDEFPVMIEEDACTKD